MIERFHVNKAFFNKLVRYLFHPIIGNIWCLHRVVPVRSAFKGNRDLEITTDFLEDMINEKRRQGYRFVDLDTFVASASGTPWKRKLIHVTFDDGFEDVYLYAYPILKKYQIPFTFYVSTDFPDGKDGKRGVVPFPVHKGAGGSEEIALLEVVGYQ